MIGPFARISKLPERGRAWLDQGFDGVARLTRRRPWLAGLFVTLGHLAVLMLLLTPPPPIPWTPPVVMDVEMVDGRLGGGGSPEGAEGAVEAPSGGDEGAADQAPEPEPTPPPEPTPATPSPEATTPAEDEPEPDAPEPPEQDPEVVAMVEALTGVKAEAIERRDAVSIDARLAETLAATPGPTGGSGGCDLTGEMRRVLQEDEAVLAALDRVPRTSRSVSNAFLLWDGGWIEGRDAVARPALALVRASVADIATRAPPECREAMSDGPRFIILDSGEATHVLVLGSGRWSWGALIAPDEERTRRPRWWPFG